MSLMSWGMYPKIKNTVFKFDKKRHSGKSSTNMISSSLTVMEEVMVIVL